MAKLESLLTASVGLYLDGNNYYLQVIFADSGRQLIQKISMARAFAISSREGVEIKQISPEYIYSLDDFKL
jgi:hypothetical protein